MPKSSIQSLQQQSEVRHTFNAWLDSLHKTQSKEHNEVSFSPVPILHPLVDEDVDDQNAISDNVVKIEMEDIQEEIDF